MATANMTIDATGFRNAIKQFTERYGFDQAEVLKDQGRLLLQSLINWTPPKTQKAGRGTINRDALKLVQYAYDDHHDLMELKKTAERSKDGQAYRWWNGRLVSVPLAAIDVDGKGMAQDHSKFRDNRGRVRRGSNIVTSVRVAKRFARSLYPHVGNVKRGWTAAAAKMGATIPAFAARSVSGTSGKASGGVVDASARSFLNPFIEVWNDTPYIRDDGFLRRAMEVRLKDIQKHLIKRMEKRAAEVSAT